MSNSHSPLFSRHEHALEKADKACPNCGAALLIKHGKSGAFWGCANYPHCDFTAQIVEHEKVEDKILPGSECPLCKNVLAVKQGRFGMFIACSHYPQCPYIDDSNKQEALDVPCPQCQQKGDKGKLIEKTNRFGKVFFSCNNYPQCKYVLNYPPVAQACPICSWPILIKRQMAQGEVLVCPEKKCNYKENSL